MKFGEPTPDLTVTADGYMVGGAIMPPPPGKIGLISLNVAQGSQVDLEQSEEP